MLLNTLEQSDVIFFKNSIPYSAKEGKNQIESNLLRSGTTIKTAEDFIKKIGSHSSQTGQVYYVKLETGEKKTLEEWFSEKLTTLRNIHLKRKKNKKRS